MEDNEWETIQASTSSATQSEEDDGDAKVVTTPINFHEPPIFDPTNQEGLPVFLQPPEVDHLQEPVPQTHSPPSSQSSSSTPYSTELSEEGELPQSPEVISTLLKAGLEVLSSWVLRVCNEVRSRTGVWSIASVTAFVTVLAYAWRWQRWRRLAEKDNKDKMLLLINQKDEKIKQLLLQIDQIDQINGALSARQSVPVFRVVVDSPLVFRPISNWKPT